MDGRPCLGRTESGLQAGSFAPGSLVDARMGDVIFGMLVMALGGGVVIWSANSRSWKVATLGGALLLAGLGWAVAAIAVQLETL